MIFKTQLQFLTIAASVLTVSGVARAQDSTAQADTARAASAKAVAADAAQFTACLPGKNLFQIYQQGLSEYTNMVTRCNAGTAKWLVRFMTDTIAPDISRAQFSHDKDSDSPAGLAARQKSAETYDQHQATQRIVSNAPLGGLLAVIVDYQRNAEYGRTAGKKGYTGTPMGDEAYMASNVTWQEYVKNKSPACQRSANHFNAIMKEADNRGKATVSAFDSFFAPFRKAATEAANKLMKVINGEPAPTTPVHGQ